VVGTDGSDRAGAAVEHAASLAGAFGAALHLVQGCGTAVVVSPLYGATAAVDANEMVEACTNSLRPLADELSARGLDVTLHVSPTSGSVALCAVADQIDADLIIVGSRGMTGARRVLGSIPNSVAHHATCSVLIVSTS
jgi:nucleotide-binding universal stress UspA family protein